MMLSPAEAAVNRSVNYIKMLLRTCTIILFKRDSLQQWSLCTEYQSLFTFIALSKH